MYHVYSRLPSIVEGSQSVKGTIQVEYSAKLWGSFRYALFGTFSTRCGGVPCFSPPDVGLATGWMTGVLVPTLLRYTHPSHRFFDNIW